MRPPYHADEAKLPPPFLSGNRRANALRAPYWLPVLLAMAAFGSSAQTVQLVTPSEIGDSALPDSPGTVWSSTATPSFESPAFDSQNPGPFDTRKNQPTNKKGQAQPCTPRAHRRDYPRFSRDRCDPYQPFVEVAAPPLTPEQKGYLAYHDVTDPFNLLTIVGTSAVTIGANSHTAFGPGMRGFGYNVGTSMGQDVTGEFIGTFAVCSLFREDPRYFRMPNATKWRRLGHAIGHIVVAQGDNGKRMPNYSNLIAAAAGAEIANLYVPGLATDGASTAERIFTGFLTEPIGTIIAEFLPDFASKIHVRIVVLQRYLNQISAQ